MPRERERERERESPASVWSGQSLVTGVNTFIDHAVHRILDLSRDMIVKAGVEKFDKPPQAKEKGKFHIFHFTSLPELAS